MTNKSGEMGEPWGVPMATGEIFRGALEEESAYSAGEETAYP